MNICWTALFVLTVLVGYVRPLTVATLNVGLTPQLSRYEERAAATPSAVSSIDADVICMQELWYTHDMLAVVEASKNTHPYSYSFKHSSVNKLNQTAIGGAACSDMSKIAAVSSCVRQRCTGYSTGIELLACADENCTQAVTSLSQECTTCLLMTGMENAQRCMTLDASPSGLLLLSRIPLENAQKGRFIPKRKLYMPRGYLAADVADAGTVICTHLTADFGKIYVERTNFTSDKDQQRSEVQTLLSITDDAMEKSGQKTVILTGDLNMGPAVAHKRVSAGYISNYEMLMKNGFQNGYVDAVGDCTWCGKNPLTPKTDLNLIYDHVLVKGLSMGVHAKRLMTKNLEGRSFPLSDHYGVFVEVREKSFWRIMMEYIAAHAHRAYRYFSGE